VHNAKLIIAEVTNPSTRTRIEIGWTLKLDKPLVCLAYKDADVTSMVLSPTHTGKIDLIRYENEEDALMKIKVLLETKFNNLGLLVCWIARQFLFNLKNPKGSCS
jgi:hypothetical protein